MGERSKIQVGFDDHKDSISVATAEPGQSPGRLIGKVTHDVNKPAPHAGRTHHGMERDAGVAFHRLQRLRHGPRLNCARSARHKV